MCSFSAATCRYAIVWNWKPLNFLRPTALHCLPTPFSCSGSILSWSIVEASANRDCGDLTWTWIAYLDLALPWLTIIYKHIETNSANWYFEQTSPSSLQFPRTKSWIAQHSMISMPLHNQVTSPCEDTNPFMHMSRDVSRKKCLHQRACACLSVHAGISRWHLDGVADRSTCEQCSKFHSHSIILVGW